jgi:type VI secretion system secreted protein Hcp
MSRRGALKIAVPTVVAVVAGGAVALGAIPSSDGTIRACYSTADPAARTLQIVDEGQACDANETLITWNQRGPQGPAGPAGPTGDPAPAGSGTDPSDSGTPVADPGGPSAQIFLKLDGIAGESTDDRHRGEIDVEALTFDVKRPNNGAGRAKFVPFRLIKSYDASSPRLLQAATNGRHIKTAVVTFRRSGDAGDTEFLTYRLSDVIVSSYQQGGTNPNDRPLGSLQDEIGLSPARVQVTERTTAANGQAGPSVTASYSFRRG